MTAQREEWRLADAELVLEGIAALQRLRGRVSKITVEDVAVLLKFCQPSLLAQLDEAEVREKELRAALESYVGDHDVHPAFMPDCPTCVALWPDRADWLKPPNPGTPPVRPSGFTSGRHG